MAATVETKLKIEEAPAGTKGQPVAPSASLAAALAAPAYEVDEPGRPVPEEGGSAPAPDRDEADEHPPGEDSDATQSGDEHAGDEGDVKEQENVEAGESQIRGNPGPSNSRTRSSSNRRRSVLSFSIVYFYRYGIANWRQSRARPAPASIDGTRWERGKSI